MTEIELFEATWTAMPAPLDAWRRDCTPEEWLAFTNVANEAVEHEQGPTVLPLGRDVAVRFRSDLCVRFLGMNTGDQGCGFFGFLFSVPGALEVMTWVETDSVGARVVWRGDKATFERAALDLAMFRGEWLPELPKAA